MLDQQSYTTEVSREEYEQLVQRVHELRKRTDETEKRVYEFEKWQNELEQRATELEKRMDELEAYIHTIGKVVIAFAENEKTKAQGKENAQESN